MAKFNLHAHTKYSNDGKHAYGTPEEIVKMAIDAGFTKWGFTEHVPFSTVFTTKRTSIENMEKYIKDVNEVKEKYKDKIEVLCGFECEAIIEEFPWYNKIVSRPDVDYVILGNHFHAINDGNLVSFHRHHPSDGKWSARDRTRLYVDSSILAFKNVPFCYMAHADRGMPAENEWDEFVISDLKRLIKYTKDNNIILAAGMPSFRYHINKKDESSFSPGFWKLVAESGNEVAIEIDYHWPRDFDQAYYNELKEILLSYGVNVISG